MSKPLIKRFFLFLFLLGCQPSIYSIEYEDGRGHSLITQLDEQTLDSTSSAVNTFPSEISPETTTRSQNGLEVPTHTLPNEMPSEIPSIHISEPELFAVIFRAFDRATLSAQVTSTVQIITKRMGEPFQAGELLIQLDDTVFEGLRQKAQGNLAKAQAELSSKEQLFQDNISSVYELKSAQANVAIAISDLISAEHAVRACHIMAPYNGKIVQLFVEIAELIQEGKPLIEIVNDQYLIGQVLVPASNLSKIILNKPVMIQVRETGETVVGKILRINPVIDPASSLIKIDIVVENQNSRLRAGMIGETALEEPNYYSPIHPRKAHRG
jgi:membrane fusion protein (multidrug efflux system)